MNFGESHSPESNPTNAYGVCIGQEVRLGTEGAVEPVLWSLLGLQATYSSPLHHLPHVTWRVESPLTRPLP